MSVEFGVWRHAGRAYNVAFANVSTLFIERQDKPNLVGGIALGRVDRLLGKGAFIRLPGKAMGYIESKRALKPGDDLPVQVSAYATEDKAWPLSTEIKLQGRRYIYLPHGNDVKASKRLQPALAEAMAEELALDYGAPLPGGWIIRSGGFGDFEDRLRNADEAKALVGKAQALGGASTDWLIAPPTAAERARRDSHSTFDGEMEPEALETRMQHLLQLDIPLHGGGRLRLGPTPALFTIDIDAGMQTDMNQLADEAAHAILLTLDNRAIGGQIVIDPVRAAARQLLDYLRTVPNGLQLTAHGLTKMGLIELSRSRLGPSLYEALQ